MEVYKSQDKEVNPELNNNFMKQITIWDYSSISRDSYEEKEKLIESYYHDMKN